MLLDDEEYAYIYTPNGLLLAVINPTNQTTYPLQDQQNTIRTLTNHAGVVTGTATYTLYGQRTTTGQTIPLGYTSEYHDTTGLIYLRNRHYNPTTGQYIQRDPLEYLTSDPYGYANGNPIMNRDPTGEFAMLAIPIGIAVVGLGVGAYALLNNDPAPPCIDDPESLRGQTHEDIAGQIPDDWIAEPTNPKKGPGIRYRDPERPRRQIRVMPGDPGDPDPVKRGPYVRVSPGNGPTSPPIPLNGNPAL